MSTGCAQPGPPESHSVKEDNEKAAIGKWAEQYRAQLQPQQPPQQQSQPSQVGG